MKRTVRRTRQELDEFDISARVCKPRGWERSPSEARIEMISFDRPATIFWNEFGKQLYRAGWSLAAIEQFLGSTYIRHGLDGYEERIQRAARDFALQFVTRRAEAEEWAAEAALQREVEAKRRRK